MTWVNLVLGIIKLANALFSWANERRLIQQGEDAVIARAAAELFAKTEHAKKVRETIDAMSEAEVDAVLVGFEPPDDVRNNKNGG